VLLGFVWEFGGEMKVLRGGKYEGNWLDLSIFFTE